MARINLSKNLYIIAVLAVLISGCGTSTPKYQLIKTEIYKANENLDIYVRDTTVRLQSINDQIVKEYNPGKLNPMLIRYFDDSASAQRYVHLFHSTDPADTALRSSDTCTRHFIALYKNIPLISYDSFQVVKHQAR